MPKITPWPNGLGWDVGRSEVWRLTRSPEDSGYPFGVRTFRDGSAHRCLRACLATEQPTEAELRCLVDRCRAHGELVQ